MKNKKKDGQSSLYINAMIIMAFPMATSKMIMKVTRPVFPHFIRSLNRQFESFYLEISEYDCESDVKNQGDP